jgi:hypothetical protein
MTPNPDDATEAEQELLDQWAEQRRLQEELAARLGWAYQLGPGGLGYPEHWTMLPGDQSDLEYIRKNPTTTRLLITTKLRMLRRNMQSDRVEGIARKLGQGTKWRIAARVPLPDTSNDRARHAAALADLDAQGPADVVMVWGTFHVRALTRAAHRRGYVPVETTWHTVLTLPAPVLPAAQAEPAETSAS